MTNFPIIPVFKEAMLGPARNFEAIIKTVLLILAFVVGLFFASFILGLFAVALGKLIEFVMPIAMLISILVLFAYLFNFWVRIGAYGMQGADWPVGGGVRAATINALKFILIGVLLLVISAVVSSVLSLLGLANAPSGLENIDSVSAIEVFKSLWTVEQTLSAQSMIMIAIYCAVYSFFSANLTHTALDSDAENLEHPHVKDFMIVLMLLNLVQIGATVIGIVLGGFVLAIALTTVVGIWVMLAIAYAHGIRYRICVAESEGAGGES